MPPAFGWWVLTKKNDKSPLRMWMRDGGDINRLRQGCGWCLGKFNGENRVLCDNALRLEVIDREERENLRWSGTDETWRIIGRERFRKPKPEKR
jgi:hypothetical protein